MTVRNTGNRNHENQHTHPALIPVLTSTGRGSDIMVPMAIPSFGGMLIEIMTMLVVPVLYCSVQEWKLTLGIKDPRFSQHEAMLASSTSQ